VAEDLRFVVPHIVRPAFSYCSHAYILSPQALDTILALRYDRNLVVIDEFLPALYTHHLRADMRALFSTTTTSGGGDRNGGGKKPTKYPIRAYAFHPSMVSQTSNVKNSGTLKSNDIIWALGAIINEEYVLIVFRFVFYCLSVYFFFLYERL
jgi:hypothetical protein